MDDAGREEPESTAPGAGPDRRTLIKAATLTGAALWATPTVLSFDAPPAYGSTCACTGTASAQLLTQRTAVAGTPTTCSVPATGSATVASFCRSDSAAKVYLWGTGSLATGTNGPMLDDIGVLSVTETATGTVRRGNIYRFQNFCRFGTTLPTNLVFSDASQRVYNGGDPNVWDYLPPQPAGGSAQTTTPTVWWTNSQPAAGNTTSVGNPGFTVATPWPGPIDVSLLFGTTCGLFTVAFEDRNRYQEYKWSNIFIGLTHP